MSSQTIAAQQIMDPRPLTALDVNDPSVSDDNKTQELSVSLSDRKSVV